MKKLTLMAIAMGMLAFTACTEKKPAAAPATQVEEVVTDSAFQQAVAGEYKSADGKRIITVNADFAVKTRTTSSGIWMSSHRVHLPTSTSSARVSIQR